MFVYLVGLFILGLCVGSFLNVVVDRIVRGESLSGRSHCEFCQQTLKYIDLLPVVSWLLQEGRCRYCRKSLSPQYPIVELATALLFSVGIYLIYPQGVELTLPGLLTVVYFLYIFSVLLSIFIIDLKYGLVLDIIVIPAIIIAALYNLVPYLWRSANLFLSLKNDPELGRYLLKTDYFLTHVLYEGRGVFFNLLGAVGLAILFTLLIKITRGRGLGSGDVLIGLLLGLIVGFPKIIVAVFFGFTLGAVVSLILVILRKKGFGQTIPLGPFLSVATLLTIFFGDKIWAWYLNLL